MTLPKQKGVTEHKVTEGRVHHKKPPPGTKLPRLNLKVSPPITKELPALASTVEKLLDDEERHRQSLDRLKVKSGHVESIATAHREYRRSTTRGSVALVQNADDGIAKQVTETGDKQNAWHAVKELFDSMCEANEKEISKKVFEDAFAAIHGKIPDMYADHSNHVNWSSFKTALQDLARMQMRSVEKVIEGLLNADRYESRNVTRIRPPRASLRPRSASPQPPERSRSPSFDGSEIDPNDSAGGMDPVKGPRGSRMPGHVIAAVKLLGSRPSSARSFLVPEHAIPDYSKTAQSSVPSHEVRRSTRKPSPSQQRLSRSPSPNVGVRRPSAKGGSFVKASRGHEPVESHPKKSHEVHEPTTAETTAELLNLSAAVEDYSMWSSAGMVPAKMLTSTKRVAEPFVFHCPRDHGSRKLFTRQRTMHACDEWHPVGHVLIRAAKDFHGEHDNDKAARPFIIFMEAEKLEQDEPFAITLKQEDEEDDIEEIRIDDLPDGEATIQAVIYDHFDVGEVGQEHMIVVRALGQAPAQLRVEVGDPGEELDDVFTVTPALGKWQSFAGYCKPQRITNVVKFTILPIKGQPFSEECPPALAIDFVEIRRVETKVRLGRPDIDGSLDPRAGENIQAIRHH